ncbi:MAG: hypothetical protein HND27_11050, partial [Bacteroidetes bacterium]|nr:hypothetical protein [Bacteroidota bacterium]NOG96300.1 hypothetical protein [Bacteroidota bacterium]
RQNYVEGFKQSLTDKFGPLDFSSADALATSYFESIKDPLTFFAISNVQMLQDITAILQNMPSYTANDYAYAAGYVSVDVLMAVVVKKYGGRVAATKVAGNLAIRSDIVLSGGRSGQLVKNLTGPANSVIKGGQGRIFITDKAGKVIWDVTKDRAKSVIHGQGFGPKVAPTQEQLNLLKQVWGN